MKKSNAFILTFLLSIGSLTTFFPARGQEVPAEAAAPSLLDRAVNGVRVTSIRVRGENQTNSVIDSDVQGGKAIRVVVAVAGVRAWDVTASTSNIKPVEQGDKLVLAVWLRSEPREAAAGPGRASLRMQLATAPYTGVAAEQVEIGPDWNLYFIIGTADQVFPVGSLTANIQLASQVQTIDVGPVFILAMGPDFDLSTIPAN